MGDSKRGKPIRLRDFIRVEDFYFSVLGYRNERYAKCFLRYVPDEKGDRMKNGKKFRKLIHDEAVSYAIKNQMNYYKDGIFKIPLNDIDEVFKPEERLNESLEYEEVRKVVEFFKNIPLTHMGVTGSRLIGLIGEESDIDFVIYGRWWFEGRERIREGIAKKKISEPDKDTWEFIYKKRKVNIPYNLFLAHEKRKFHRAVLGDTYFDLLYVRDYSELNRKIPEDKGIKIGSKTIQAKVVDDSFVFDYPAYYKIEHEEVEAILSFTHTYIGQAFKNETIEAKGDLEIIDDKKYIVVGSKREVEDEYIVSLDLIEKSGLKEEFKKWKN
ncbi:DNA polymerase subunit beta [Archaeoglobales archaeon]|nr:MAG: DNA polymerase subunit beta [Archaeoglobales archaeon]